MIVTRRPSSSFRRVLPYDDSARPLTAKLLASLDRNFWRACQSSKISQSPDRHESPLGVARFRTPFAPVWGSNPRHPAQLKFKDANVSRRKEL